MLWCCSTLLVDNTGKITALCTMRMSTHAVRGQFVDNGHEDRPSLGLLRAVIDWGQFVCIMSITMLASEI